MDPLAELQNMPKEPQLGEGEEKEIQNQEYNKKPEKDFGLQKNELFTSLYGPKKETTADDKNEDNNKESLSGENEKKPGNENISSHPVLERFKDMGVLNQEIFDNLLISLEEGISIEDFFEKEEGVDKEDKKKIIEVVNNLDNPTQIKENKKDFIKDFKEISGNKIDLKTDNVMNLVGENYFKIEGKNGKESIDNNFSMSVKIASNKIIEKSNFNTEGEAYKKAIERIHSGNHEEEYKGLKYLFTKAGKNKGKGKQQVTAFKNMKKGVEKKQETLNVKFEKFKENLKTSKTEKNIDELKDLLLEGQDLQDEADESGDIFIATELDTLTKETQNTLKELQA